MIHCGGTPGPIMFIGDYPTKNECEVGEAFTGSIGSVLNKCLIPFRKKITDYYSTYLIKEYVQGYGAEDKKKKEAAWKYHWELRNWGKLIQEEISIVKPNVIVAFGEEAFRFLVNEKEVNKHRGSILNLVPHLDHFDNENFATKIIPITEPRKILQESYRPVVYTQWDLQKAFNYSTIRARFQDKSNIWIVRSPREFENWWSRAQYGEFLTIDIETHLGFITCIGFCHDGVEAISVPLINSKLSFHELGLTYMLLDRIFRSRIPKVNQNFKFDLNNIDGFGFYVHNIHDDTMLLAHSIYPELPKGLDFLNSIYTEIPYYKDESGTYDPKQFSYETLLRYNAKDALSTWIVYKKQIEDAKIQKVWDFHRKKVWPTFEIYRKSDKRGMRYDNERRLALVNKYQEVYRKSILPLKLIAKDRDFKVDSPQQVGRLLYEIIGLKTRRHQTAKGNYNYSTDKKTIEGILIKNEEGLSDEVAALIKRIPFCRQVKKVLTFLKALPSLDGRFRQFSKLGGTETGRTSSGKPIEVRYLINEDQKIAAEECGWGFQTIGKHPFRGLDGETYGDDLRTIFVPSPGMVFINGDQSQAEARVVCVVAKDFKTLSIMEECDRDKSLPDFHKRTAAMILGKDPKLITKDERQWVGKTGRHAGNYNESPGGLMLRTHKPMRECRLILGRFHEEVPFVRQNFHQGIRDLISKQRYLVSPSGRRRDFFGTVTEDMFKEAFATIPQATVSDHTKHTVIMEMDKKWYSKGVYLLSEAHDGVLYEVPKEMASEVSEDLKQFIAIPISFALCSMSSDAILSIPGDVHIYEDSWKAEE